MTKINIKNEKVKRQFFKRLKESKGRCDSTVNSIERAILIYEDFTKMADFATYKPDKAIEFKKWLRKREVKGKTISVTTYCVNIPNFLLKLSVSIFIQHFNRKGSTSLIIILIDNVRLSP